MREAVSSQVEGSLANYNAPERMKAVLVSYSRVRYSLSSTYNVQQRTASAGERGRCIMVVTAEFDPQAEQGFCRYAIIQPPISRRAPLISPFSFRMGPVGLWIQVMFGLWIPTSVSSRQAVGEGSD